ncbi:MAG: hypothetical protein FWG92_02855 [Leptospirales bacterium]|nr:hypothetical protein [Leptospirales bacterium]
MTENALRHLLEAVFYIVIPIIAIFFRIKKKITTGFAVGIAFSSFALGLISVATAVKNDPVSAFMQEVNLKNYEEAKRNYKIVVQYGDAYLNKINEADIIDLSFFQKIREETASEYIKIAKDYYESCSPENDSIKDEDLHKLKHALKLLSMAESIGRPHQELKEKIEKKLAAIE